MDISERFKKLPSLVKKKSLRQIALDIDVTPQSLNRIAAGENKPGFDILTKILNQYPINAAWLMKGEGAPLLDKAEGKKHQPMIDTDLYDLRKLVSEMDQLRRRVDRLEGDK